MWRQHPFTAVGGCYRIWCWILCSILRLRFSSPIQRLGSPLQIWKRRQATAPALTSLSGVALVPPLKLTNRRNPMYCRVVPREVCRTKSC